MNKLDNCGDSTLDRFAQWMQANYEDAVVSDWKAALRSDHATEAEMEEALAQILNRRDADRLAASVQAGKIRTCS